MARQTTSTVESRFALSHIININTINTIKTDVHKYQAGIRQEQVQQAQTSARFRTARIFGHPQELMALLQSNSKRFCKLRGLQLKASFTTMRMMLQMCGTQRHDVELGSSVFCVAAESHQAGLDSVLVVTLLQASVHNQVLWLLC